MRNNQRERLEDLLSRLNDNLSAANSASVCINIAAGHKPYYVGGKQRTVGDDCKLIDQATTDASAIIDQLRELLRECK